MGETELARGGPGTVRRGLAKFVCGIRRGVADAASLYALPHRGAVAPASATGEREIHCAGQISRSANGMERCKRARKVPAHSGGNHCAAKYSLRDEAGPQEESRCGAFQQ